jgi:hypothetical protein
MLLEERINANGLPLSSLAIIPPLPDHLVLHELGTWTVQRKMNLNQDARPRQKLYDCGLIFDPIKCNNCKFVKHSSPIPELLTDLKVIEEYQSESYRPQFNNGTIWRHDGVGRILLVAKPAEPKIQFFMRVQAVFANMQFASYTSSFLICNSLSISPFPSIH